MPPESLFPLDATFLAAGGWSAFAEQTINGLTFGALIALIALGYTMVYGIIGMINFAHGDVFMLGCCVAWAIVAGLSHALGLESSATGLWWVALAPLFAAPVFCGALNVGIDWLVYKPLRNAPKLAPLVSAIGVSFVLMNLGQLWIGPADRSFSRLALIPDVNLTERWGVRFALVDLIVICVTAPIMIALTWFVTSTRLGKAMRAVEQNPIAAQLMGIDSDRVVALTFFIGGALAGVGSVVYALKINTISYQMGFQNGLYAFTAAVLGGIGKLPGAVLGGLAIGLIRAYTSQYIDEKWTGAMVFAVLIVVLVFRPSGLLGATAKEKV